MKITELKLKPEILNAVAQMGYEELTPVQEKTIPFLLAKRDVEVEAPTGTGKTACYSLPLLNEINPNGIITALILCPTRELAVQVVKEINKFSSNLPLVKTVAIYGGQNPNYQIKALQKSPAIAVGTPGRILDLIARKKLDIAQVTYLVLDECDEMLDMGFIRDIDKIIGNIKGAHQTSLFSATISPEIKKISKKYLDPSFVGIKVERDSAHLHQIEQKYVKVSETEKKNAIVSLLNSVSFSRAFVFCRTKHKVMQIAKLLQGNTQHSVTSLQGNLSQNKRDKAMQNFRNYSCDVMVATDIAARGIDVSDVDLVVNYDIPEQDEFYLHRIGRTGRVEAKGTSYTFLTKSQLPLIKKYEAMSKSSLSEYVIDNKGNTIIMNQYLKSLAPLLNVNKDKVLAEIEDACKEYSEKAGRTILPIELAAMMLLKQSEKPVFDSAETKENDFKPRKVAAVHSKGEVATSDDQRFFVNLGAVDGLDEEGLVSFLCSQSSALNSKDFVDVCLKDTYSFFAINKSKASEALAIAGSTQYQGRKVEIEVAAPRKSPSHDKSFHQEKRGFSHHGHYEKRDFDKKSAKPDFHKNFHSSHTSHTKSHSFHSSHHSFH